MRLNSVDFPTFGRPTMATIEIAAAVETGFATMLSEDWLNSDSVPLAAHQPLPHLARNRYYRDFRASAF